MKKLVVILFFLRIAFVGCTQQVDVVANLSRDLQRMQNSLDYLIHNLDYNDAYWMDSISILENQIKIRRNQIQRPINKVTTIAVDIEEFKYGTINEGDLVRHTFMVTNTGLHILLIKDVKVSCGCTVPQWSDKAIAPGATTPIEVTFNSAGKGLKGSTLEYASKITMVANTEPAETYLVLRGFIKK